MLVRGCRRRVLPTVLLLEWRVRFEVVLLLQSGGVCALELASGAAPGLEWCVRFGAGMVVPCRMPLSGAASSSAVKVGVLVSLQHAAAACRCSMPLQHAAACCCRVPGRSCTGCCFRVLLSKRCVCVCVIWGRAGAVCALELACWCRCRVLLQGAAGRVVRALWAWVPPQGAVQGAASGCCC